jgi:hypothetical protein
MEWQCIRKESHSATPVSLKWRARSSPDELLQRQDLVSVIRFACWKPRSAKETSAARIKTPGHRRSSDSPHRSRRNVPRRPLAWGAMEGARARGGACSGFHRVTRA